MRVFDIIVDNDGAVKTPISCVMGSLKNNLVEFAPEFAVDLIDLICLYVSTRRQVTQIHPG